jgi:hypothetical protein
MAEVKITLGEEFDQMASDFEPIENTNINPLDGPTMEMMPT